MLARAFEKPAAVLGAACLALALGCEPGPRSEGPVQGADAAPGGDVERDAAALEPRCRVPQGMSAAPGSIAEAVALINALPKPVTLPCFLEALQRPLALHATVSIFSAQPAEGRRSPRIFIFYPGLILSVVPAGIGAHLLEFGELRPGDRTLKAELELPIERALDEAAPYERVYYDGTITTCGFCHQGEQLDESIASPLAFVSPALRPREGLRVPLDELALEAEACASGAGAGIGEGAPDAGSERERCAMLRALFDQAPAPLERDFPSSFLQL